MARTARLINPDGGAYHIICRGNNRNPVFYNEDDYLSYLSIIGKIKKEMPFLLYHYVLMTNHVHLILSPTQNTELSKLMKNINQNHSLRHKYRYGFIGHLWQDRFKSLIISEDSYLLTCGIYIELNPVRAKIVNKPGDYPWSSYKTYAFGEPNDLLDVDPVFSSIADKIDVCHATYRTLVEMWRFAKFR